MYEDLNVLADLVQKLLDDRLYADAETVARAHNDILERRYAEDPTGYRPGKIGFVIINPRKFTP